MTPTPTDLTAIDLERRLTERLERRDATIEALRARVAELEPLVKDGVRRGLNCMEWQTRAEAAEAREAVLAGALEPLTQWVANSKGEHGDDFLNEDGWDDLDQLDAAARAALATTPAQALSRAKAVDEVITTARCIAECRAYRGAHRGVEEALRSDLAKLDALGKEGP